MMNATNFCILVCSEAKDILQVKIDIQPIISYISSRHEEFLQDLKGLIKIPTVGAKKEHNNDIIRGAEFVASLLQKAQVDNIKIFHEYAKPLVYAEKILNPNYKTILLYAHYDVQPVEPLELWETDPFELTMCDDKMFGRGVSDAKGSVLQIIKAVETLIKTDSLHCNIKIIFEGEEEIGSAGFIHFLQQKENVELLKNDLIILNDVSISNSKNPIVVSSARGIVCADLKVIGANKDLHSGSFGGLVGNPIHALASIINSFHDENNHIAIENFYHGVEDVSEQYHNFAKNFFFDEDEIKKNLDITDFVNEKKYLPVEAVGLRPTIEINGINGGYTGDGIKTVLPSYATTKISCRLVFDQDPAFILTCLQKHIAKHCPRGFTFELKKIEGSGKSFNVDINAKYFEDYRTAFAEEYGKKPIPLFEGGSIPVGSYMKERVNKNVLLTGFFEQDANTHAPNENLRTENFFKGIKVLARFIAAYE